MGWLDKLPSRRARKAEAELAAARQAIERLAYDAAKRSARLSRWGAGNSGPNAEIADATQLTRARMRDLVRNNPYAASAVDALTSALVGDGIRPQVQLPRTTTIRARRDGPKWRRGQQVAASVYTEWLWDRWQRECYRSSRLGFYGLQVVAARAMFESGECLLRFRDARVEGALWVPLQLQILESDFLDDLKHGPTSNGYLCQGVEFDIVDRRRGYWLFPSHPGETARGVAALASSFVPATQIEHIYDPTCGRPGQVRGISPMTSVVKRLFHVDQYEDIEIIRRQVASTLAVLIQSDAPMSADGTPASLGARITDSSGAPVDVLTSGLIATVTGSESITPIQPPQVSDYGQFLVSTLHAVAAGIGLPYEELTGDLSGTNYSSIRFGRLKFLRRLRQIRAQAFIPMLCDPTWQRFINDAVGAGELDEGLDYPVEWQPPRWEEVDRQKEENGIAAALANMTTSPQREIRRSGDDPETIRQEIEEHQAWCAARGLAYPGIDVSAPDAVGAPAAENAA